MDENDPAGAPRPPSGATGRLTPVPDKVRGFGRPLPERASRKNASPSPCHETRDSRRAVPDRRGGARRRCHRLHRQRGRPRALCTLPLRTGCGGGRAPTGQPQAPQPRSPNAPPIDTRRRCHVLHRCAGPASRASAATATSLPASVAAPTGLVALVHGPRVVRLVGGRPSTRARHAGRGVRLAAGRRVDVRAVSSRSRSSRRGSTSGTSAVAPRALMFSAPRSENGVGVRGGGVVELPPGLEWKKLPGACVRRPELVLACVVRRSGRARCPARARQGAGRSPRLATGARWHSVAVVLCSAALRSVSMLANLCGPELTSDRGQRASTEAGRAVDVFAVLPALSHACLGSRNRSVGQLWPRPRCSAGRS